MEENKKREDEIETLDLGSAKKDDNKQINEDLEGTSEENIKDTILNKDLNETVKHENFEDKIMAEDNSVDNVFGEEFVGLDNLESSNNKNRSKKKGGLLARERYISIGERTDGDFLFKRF